MWLAVDIKRTQTANAENVTLETPDTDKHSGVMCFNTFQLLEECSLISQ